MGNKNSSLKGEVPAIIISTTTATPSTTAAASKSEKKLKKEKSIKVKNSSTTNISINHTNDLNNNNNNGNNGSVKNKKQKDKRSKSIDNINNNKTTTPSYTPSVFKSPSNLPTDGLGNKQLSCVILPDQQLDIKVYKKNRDSIADKHLTIQRAQRTRSLQRSRSSALRKSTDTLTSTSSRQPRYPMANPYQASLLLEEDVVMDDLPGGMKGVVFPCEEKIQRHKLLFERSFQELFVDYYYTSLQEIVQLSAIIIAYKRITEEDDAEVSYDPINLYQYIRGDGEVPVDLFVPPNDGVYIPALPLNSLAALSALRGVEDVEEQLRVCHELVRCVVGEACKELSGVYEYQVSVLSDQASVETAGRHAAERAIEYLRSGNRFVERDSIVEGVAYLPVEDAVTNNKTQFVSAILGDDREFKWDVSKMFNACALRLFENQQHYYNYDQSINPTNENWESSLFLSNSTSSPLTYGYRGAIFKKDIESARDVISQVDLDLFTDATHNLHGDIHRYYVPIDVKKRKAVIRSLFRHPTHRHPSQLLHSPTSSSSSRHFSRCSNSLPQEQHNHHHYNNNNSHYNNHYQHDSRLSKQSGVVLTAADESIRSTLVARAPERGTLLSNDSEVTIVNAGEAARNTHASNSPADAGHDYGRRVTHNSHYVYDNYHHNNNNNINGNGSYQNNNIINGNYHHNNINGNTYNNTISNGRLSNLSQRPESNFPRNSRATQSYHTMHAPNNNYNNLNPNGFQNHNNYNNLNVNSYNNYNNPPYKNLVKRRSAKLSPSYDITPNNNYHNNNNGYNNNSSFNNNNNYHNNNNNAPNAVFETSFDYNSDQVIVNEVTENQIFQNGVNPPDANGMSNGDVVIKNGFSDSAMRNGKNAYVSDDVFEVANGNGINGYPGDVIVVANGNGINGFAGNKSGPKLPPKPPQRTVSSSSRPSLPITTSNIPNKGVLLNRNTVANCSNGVRHADVNGNGHAHMNGGNGQEEKKDFLDFGSFLKLVEKQNANLKSFDQKIENFKKTTIFTKNPDDDPTNQNAKENGGFPKNGKSHIFLNNSNNLEDSSHLQQPQSPISNRPSSKLAFSNV